MATYNILLLQYYLRSVTGTGQIYTVICTTTTVLSEVRQSLEPVRYMAI